MWKKASQARWAVVEKSIHLVEEASGSVLPTTMCLHDTAPINTLLSSAVLSVGDKEAEALSLQLEVVYTDDPSSCIINRE